MPRILLVLNNEWTGTRKGIHMAACSKTHSPVKDEKMKNTGKVKDEDVEMDKHRGASNHLNKILK